MNLLQDNPAEQRSCGTCSVCCTVMGIKEELNKPNYETCKYVDCGPEGCCSIYQIRPKPCKDFLCLYASGHFGRNEGDRPDNLGLMFVAFPIRMGNYEYAITVWATNEEVLKEERIKYLLTKVAKIRPIIIRSKNSYKIYGRRREVEAIEEHMKRVNNNGIEIKETSI